MNATDRSDAPILLNGTRVATEMPAHGVVHIEKRNRIGRRGESEVTAMHERRKKIVGQSP